MELNKCSFASSLEQYHLDAKRMAKNGNVKFLTFLGSHFLLDEFENSFWTEIYWNGHIQSINFLPL